MLRGVIAHRAVLWPFTRPCTGNWLEHYRHHRALQAEVDITMDILESAIRNAWSTGHTAQYRTVEALLNLNGPSDEKAAFEHISRALTPDQRDVVLAGLRYHVRNAANALEAWIRTRGMRGDDFVCVWSETPIVAIDGYFDTGHHEGGDVQADLLGFRAGGDVEVIDLKFGTMKPVDWVVEQDRIQINRYLETARAHISDPSRHVIGRLLYVGRGASTTRWTPWQTIDA